ncbi:MAG: glutamyl-tRNA reductase [Acidobacteria bacterium]|nr:MAG: glutamyl-tRNA reductase [Acidobacteriota bacterium]
MNLVLVGINHRTAPVEVRERMNIQESRLPGAVANLVQRPGIREGLILSTCNRVEVAASVEDDVEAEPLLRRFLLDYHRCDLAPWEPYFYWRRQEDVVRHLFRVASSLDSMILGEPQILGQVKRAIAAAREVGALSGVLNEVMNQALSVARRVRRETALGSAAVSVSYAAVELGKKIFGSLNGKTVFVIGAGKMSELSAKHLLQAGARAIFVSNRTYDRALELAAAFQGTAIHFEQIFDTMDQADIIISSTGAPHFIVRKDQAERLLQARKNRPIFFVDIAVPRDIDPAVNELDNAFVYDIDDLEQVVDANKKQREREAVWAEEIVNQEVQRMARRLASRDVAPTIVALEERLSRIRQNELDRFRGRLSTLTAEQREAVEALTRGMLNKILHGPISELKSAAGRPEHRALVELIRKIFGVD